MSSASKANPLLRLIACVCFVLLATANSGGYRYGISDQAFYEPAVQLQLHPEYFPHDRPLLESQSKLTLVDEVVSTASRATGLDLPWLFFSLYLISLVALYFAAEALARVLGFSPLTAGFFIGLLTLRHRIAKTGANTLEGYMHPRQLAFAIGVFALATSLRNQWLWTALLCAAAAAIHPTTAFWFGAFIIGGAIFSEMLQRWRVATIAALLVIIAMAAFVTSALLRRPDLPSPMFMDAGWTAVFADKDYVFASTWPAYAWLFNLAYLPVIWLIYRRRARARTTHSHEHRLVAGAMTLFTIFAVVALLAEAKLALAVQLQVSRVFWILDFIAMGYIAWLIREDPSVVRWTGATVQREMATIAALLMIIVFRGGMTVKERDARLFQIHMPSDAWGQTMSWLKTQPANWQVLADPDHAWKYGVSVRVGASRDVVLETVKDSAISLYSRDTAMRTAERTRALAGFGALSADDARVLGHKYDATVMITDASRDIALPRLYSNDKFIVYDIR